MGIEVKSLKALLGCYENNISVALISDTHIGGQFESFERYKQAYEIIAEFGIKDVFHLGDFFEGGSNPNDTVYNQSLEQTMLEKDIEKAIFNYPSIPSIKTFIVRGYHDTMYDKNLDRLCMIEQLCRYREDLINITSQTITDAKYLNVHSDIYLWDNVKILFRHGDAENISINPTREEIALTITGHYHNFKFGYHEDFQSKNELPNNHRLHVPELRTKLLNDEADFVLMKLGEEYIEIDPIYMDNNQLTLSKKTRIYR